MAVGVLMGWVAVAQPVPVGPQNEAIRYVGRFTDDYRFGWTGCRIEVDFQGSELSAELEVVDGPAAGLTVVVDGKARFLKISRGRKTYPLFQGMEGSGKHRIALFKRSEGALGTVQFHGFQTSEGAILSRPPERARKMWVIGDSITCGYGNEAATIEEGNTLENENGYMSYAPIAARALNADLMMFCWSGRGLCRNRQLSNDRDKTIPKIFDQTLPMTDSIKWDHARFVPGVVVINLGTNDMAEHDGIKVPLSKDEYVDAYKRFVKRIRSCAPESKIILSIGPMTCAPVGEWLSEIARAFDGVSVLIYSPAQGTEDLGGDYHPRVKKDREMAAELIRVIHRVTGWEFKGLL